MATGTLRLLLVCDQPLAGRKQFIRKSREVGNIGGRWWRRVIEQLS